MIFNLDLEFRRSLMQSGTQKRQNIQFDEVKGCSGVFRARCPKWENETFIPELCFVMLIGSDPRRRVTPRISNSQKFLTAILMRSQ